MKETNLIKQLTKNIRAYEEADLDYGTIKTLSMIDDEADKYSNYEAEIKKLKDAAIAYQNLSICYRIGKQPTEKLFKALDKANKILKEIDNK